MLPGALKDAVDVWTWRRCYSMQEVNSALSKVQLVGYSQKVVRMTFYHWQISGFSSTRCYSGWNIILLSCICFLTAITSYFLQELFGAVQISPLSSGYSLGSSNWIIQSHHEKVAYVSGSSLLTTHPQVGQQAELLRTYGWKNKPVMTVCSLSLSRWTKAPWRTAMFWSWLASPRCPLPTQTACWENSAATSVG